ncbi:hypothetical protein PAMP_006172 [Pampus punctatissimus]
METENKGEKKREMRDAQRGERERERVTPTGSGRLMQAAVPPPGPRPFTWPASSIPPHHVKRFDFHPVLTCLCCCAAALLLTVARGTFSASPRLVSARLPP